MSVSHSCVALALNIMSLPDILSAQPAFRLTILCSLLSVVQLSFSSNQCPSPCCWEFIHTWCNGSPVGGSSTPHRRSLELRQSVQQLLGPLSYLLPKLFCFSQQPVRGKSWLFQALFHLRTFNATEVFSCLHNHLWARQAVPSNPSVFALITSCESLLSFPNDIQSSQQSL